MLCAVSLSDRWLSYQHWIPPLYLKNNVSLNHTHWSPDALSTSQFGFLAWLLAAAAY